MKKLMLCCAVCLCLTTVSFAQQETPQVTLTISNAKGKPMDKALVFLSSSRLYREVDKQGSFSFYPTAKDTIFVTLNNYKGAIPFAGQAQIDICFDKKVFYNAKDPSVTYPTMKLPSLNTAKIHLFPDIESYGRVSFLIEQKFPSILIKKVDGYNYLFLNGSNLSTNVVNQNNNSSNMVIFHSPAEIGAAEILVDGKPYNTIDEVDREVKLKQLKNISYEKPDPMFGKGGGGRVTITTLNGE